MALHFCVAASECSIELAIFSKRIKQTVWAQLNVYQRWVNFKAVFSNCCLISHKITLILSSCVYSVYKQALKNKPSHQEKCWGGIIRLSSKEAEFSVSVWYLWLKTHFITTNCKQSLSTPSRFCYCRKQPTTLQTKAFHFRLYLYGIRKL